MSSQVLMLPHSWEVHEHVHDFTNLLLLLQVWLWLGRILPTDPEWLWKCQHPPGDLCLRLPVHEP